VLLCLRNDGSASATRSAAKFGFQAFDRRPRWKSEIQAGHLCYHRLGVRPPWGPPARLTFFKFLNSRSRDGLLTLSKQGRLTYLVAKKGRQVLTGTDTHPMPSYTSQHLAETAEIVQKIDPETLEKMVDLLADVRNRGGRLFFLGVGGSAANASHAVNDFRKIAGFESYAPTDNVSELTARTNDEGWASVFVEWLKGSRLQSRDALMVFSVGGGNLEKNVSPNLVAALQYAQEIGASVL